MKKLCKGRDHLAQALSFGGVGKLGQFCGEQAGRAPGSHRRHWGNSPWGRRGGRGVSDLGPFRGGLLPERGSAHP